MVEPATEMAALFDTSRTNIVDHLGHIYAEGELEKEATIRKFRIVRSEGSRQVTRSIDHYHLDAIISVGYRVNSVRATQFRQWATSVLRDFAIRGSVIDRQRMENGTFLGEDYFERLLDEIREIRLSELVSTRRSPTSTPPASTTTRTPLPPSASSPPFRTSSTTPSTATPPPSSSPPAPGPTSPTWA